MFPGSGWGNSVASKFNYLLPTVTQTDTSNVAAVEGSMQEPCSFKQADARLVAGHASSEKAVCDSFKTLQGIKCSEKKKQSKMWKWSKEGQQNPPLPAAGDNGGYVLTKELLELAPFAKVFATGPDDLLSNQFCFYSMLCKRNISMRTS